MSVKFCSCYKFLKVVHYERNFTVCVEKRTKLFVPFELVVTKSTHIWIALDFSGRGWCNCQNKHQLSNRLWSTPPKKKSTLWLQFCLFLHILDLLRELRWSVFFSYLIINSIWTRLEGFALWLITYETITRKIKSESNFK